MLQKLEDELKLKGCTSRTIKCYIWHVVQYLETGLTKREYLLNLTKNYAPASIRLAAAAISFYEKHILKQQSEYISIPKKQSKLPQILTKQQILTMIEATDNEKHKIIVEMLYSSGLRLQELINLKYEHIDFENKIIYVKLGKGQKDRITLIGQRVLDRLDKQGSSYVLKGRKGKYSKHSVQLVVQKLAKEAGIKQQVTPHLLRHSFATHLLENGTDIRYIQALLGHQRLETTQVYTKVAKHNLKNISNPLD